MHAVVALAPLPLVLSLGAGWWWPTVLVAMGVLLGATGVAARNLRRARRCVRACAIAERAAAVLIDAVYEQWLEAEAERGSLELDRWRRTHPRRGLPGH